MSWNEAARRTANQAFVVRYGSWVPTGEDANHPTLRKVLEHMLVSLPDEALETFFGHTDMTFVCKPPRVIPAGTATYDYPLGVPKDLHEEGFAAWKVWYVGDVNGKKPMEESPQRDADAERLRDEDRSVSGQQEG